jgi:hypothetical protein
MPALLEFLVDHLKPRAKRSVILLEGGVRESFLGLRRTFDHV